VILPTDPLYRDINAEVLGVLTSAGEVTRKMLAHREVAEQQARELDRLKEGELFREMTSDVGSR
jgi:hypothetical protein